MLIHLAVNNFAIVEHLDIELHKGMTTITGETGAGKSIMLDALGLALGDRADSGVVRPGSDKADIQASFDLAHIPEARNWLTQRSSRMGPASCAGSSLPKAAHAPTSTAARALKPTSRRLASC